jgi:hypothetical protein
VVISSRRRGGFVRYTTGFSVPLRGMSSKKHFPLPERQKYFSGIQPPATLPTLLFWLLDLSTPLLRDPISRGTTGFPFLLFFLTHDGSHRFC